MYKAIIYDLDGTLIDTFKMNFIPLQELLKEELGIDKTYEQLLEYVTFPGLKAIAHLGFPNVEESYQKWVDKVNAYPGGATAFDGVEEVLDYFHQKGVTQAVVSSKKRDQYVIDVTSKGWDSYFSAVILEEDTINHKPDPDPLYTCLQKLKLQPKDVIYIGDGYSDYLCCQAAGIDFGLAKWCCVETRPMPATHVFDNPLAITQLFTK